MFYLLSITRIVLKFGKSSQASHFFVFSNVGLARDLFDRKAFRADVSNGNLTIVGARARAVFKSDTGAYMRWSALSHSQTH